MKCSRAFVVAAFVAVPMLLPAFIPAALSQTDQKARTTTVVSSDVNPSDPLETVTFKATVSATAPGTGIPEGSVEFIVDGTGAGSQKILDGVATYSTSTLAVGSHKITAVYSGSSAYEPSRSEPLVHYVR